MTYRTNIDGKYYSFNNSGSLVESYILACGIAFLLDWTQIPITLEVLRGKRWIIWEPTERDKLVIEAYLQPDN